MMLNSTTTPPEFPTFPYDDAALLQAIATIIAGILIFLTITPLATKGYGQNVSEIKHGNTVIIYMTITLMIFITCVILISFPVSPEESEFMARGIARILFFLGLVGVTATIGLFIRRITTQQKGEDL